MKLTSVHLAQRWMSVIALLAMQLAVARPLPADASCNPAPTGGDDTITCDGANDSVNGGNGNDTVYGNDGNDSLTGGSGNDTLDGGAGNDTLNGQAGNDTLIGGDGMDSYTFDADSDIGADTVQDTDGTDTLNFGSTGTSTRHLTVDLSSNATQVVSPGFHTLTILPGTTIENVTGGSGNDTLAGNSANNALSGGAGNDILDGGSGNDTLNGGSGTDRVVQTVDANQTLTNMRLTGQGTDTLTSIERATLTGGASDNTLNASAYTAGPVILNGLGGNDVLLGGRGADALDGGDGDDRLTGGSGNDTLIGGVGTDTVVQAVNANQVLTNALLTGTGNDSLSSIESAELTGGTGNNAINASAFTAGPVSLFGLAGNDTLTGGSGNDALDGGTGNDTLAGNAGNDSLTGGAGNDSYSFNTNSPLGSDAVQEVSGQGTDTLTFTGSTAAVVVDLGIAGGAQVVNANLTLTLAMGEVENVIGGSGNDTLTGNAGNNVLNGGSGTDRVVQTADANQTLTNTRLTGQGTDTLTSIERATLTGGASDNTLNASAFTTGPVILNGLGGNDVLLGGSGADALDGGDGDDRLTGGSGNDALVGGLGNDTYNFDIDSTLGTDTITEVTDEGADTISFSGSTTGVNFDLGVAGAQSVHTNLRINLTDPQVENATGGNGNDTLTGNGLNNTLNGGSGNDTLSGRDGDDSLDGGSGNDSLSGEAGTDSLNGGPGNDVLSGGDGDDSLIGGAGDDHLAGDQGNDTLTTDDGIDDIDGGAGDDSLVITGLHVAGDRVSGGSGVNTFSFQLGTSGALEAVSAGEDTLDFSLFGVPIHIDLGYSGQQDVGGGLHLTLTGLFRNLIGTLFDDILTGNTADNALNGLDGQDILDGGAGQDMLDGGPGTDTVANYDPLDTHTDIESGLPPAPQDVVNDDEAGSSLAAVLVRARDGLIPISCLAPITRLLLPSGDYVEFAGLCGYEAEVKLESIDLLPPGLAGHGDPWTAVSVTLFRQGSPVPVIPAPATLSFWVPQVVVGQPFSVLYWDALAKDGAGEWLELPPEGADTSTTEGMLLRPTIADDGQPIVCGVWPTPTGRVEVKVNFTGTFVVSTL